MSWFDIGAQYLQQTIQEAEKFVFEEVLVPVESDEGTTNTNLPQNPASSAPKRNTLPTISSSGVPVHLTTGTSPNSVSSVPGPNELSTTKTSIAVFESADEAGEETRGGEISRGMPEVDTTVNLDDLNPDTNDTNAQPGTNTTTETPETATNGETSILTATNTTDSTATNFAFILPAPPEINNEGTERETTNEEKDEKDERGKEVGDKKYSQQAAIIKSLQQQLSRSQEFLKARATQIATIQSQNTDLEERLRLTVKERDDCKSALREKEIALENVRKEAEKLRSEGTEMANKMVNAQQDATKLRKENKNIQTQIDNAAEERKRLKDKISKRDDRIRELVTERDSYARSVSSTQDSSVSVLKQLETARKENLAFAAQITELQQTKEKLNKEKDQQKEEYSAANKALKDQYQALVLAKKSGEEAKEAEFKEKLATFRASFIVDQRQVDNKSAELEEKIEALQAHIQELQSHTNPTTTESNEENYMAEIKALQFKISMLEKDVKDRDDINSRLEDKIRKMNDTSSSILTQTLQGDLQRLQGENEELSQKIKELQLQIRNNSLLYSQLDKALSEKNKMFATLQMVSDGKDKKMIQAQQSQAREVKSLMTRISQLEQALEQAQLQLRRMNEEARLRALAPKPTPTPTPSATAKSPLTSPSPLIRPPKSNVITPTPVQTIMPTPTPTPTTSSTTKHNHLAGLLHEEMKHQQNSLHQEEITTLQITVQNLRVSHKRLEDKLLEYTTHSEELQKRILQLEEVETEKKEVEEKLYTALEIIGEKEEEIDSLKMDLGDLKTTYRQHIDLLSKRL